MSKALDGNFELGTSNYEKITVLKLYFINGFELRGKRLKRSADEKKESAALLKDLINDNFNCLIMTLCNPGTSRDIFFKL